MYSFAVVRAEKETLSALLTRGQGQALNPSQFQISAVSDDVLLGVPTQTTDNLSFVDMSAKSGSSVLKTSFLAESGGVYASYF